jgi:hypothetical protein
MLRLGNPAVNVGQSGGREVPICSACPHPAHQVLVFDGAARRRSAAPVQGSTCQPENQARRPARPEIMRRNRQRKWLQDIG